MTYSGDPASSPRDALRWLLGDTSMAPLASDAELDFAILQSPGDLYQAAALAAEALAAKFAGEVGYNADGVSIDTSGLSDQYRALALQLRLTRKYANQVAAPYVGGISQSDKELVAADGDRVHAQFGIGFQDNRQSGGGSQGSGGDFGSGNPLRGGG